MEPSAMQLRVDGFTVLDVGLGGMVQELRQQLMEETTKFGEFKPGTRVEDMILGGFSALGNPSSFHNPTVRKIRELVQGPVQRFFTVFEGVGNRKLEQVIDRLMIRVPGRVTTKESFHRDVCPSKKDGDTIFGGWINLDEVDQFFSCCPGSQINTGVGTGFVPIKKGEIPYWRGRSRCIRIPSGSVLIFNEDLVHEVFSMKHNYTSMRLFLGWRLTNDTRPLVPGIFRTLKKQGVVQIKSHQYPTLFAKLHWVNWKNKLQVFKNVLRNRCVVKVKCNNTGEIYKLPHPLGGRMCSLKTYKLPMYTKYTRVEVSKHKPTTLQ